MFWRVSTKESQPFHDDGDHLVVRLVQELDNAALIDALPAKVNCILPSSYPEPITDCTLLILPAAICDSHTIGAGS